MKLAFPVKIWSSIALSYLILQFLALVYAIDQERSYVEKSH